MFAKNPPNGRKTGRPMKGPHGLQKAGAHGSQMTGTHGLQTIGSHGMQATGKQGLQPFQTTERRPKMPASAVVVAARKTIAVNADNKRLCFMLILLKKLRLGNLLATVATFLLLGGIG